jgi:hypothetical protein
MDSDSWTRCREQAQKDREELMESDAEPCEAMIWFNMRP